jgi:type IV secretory pathway VirB6-like protein
MNVLHHLAKGKKKIDESSSSSRSRLDTTSSLFQVIVSFNFHLLFFTIIYYILLIFLFAGHFIEGAPKKGTNGGFDSSRASGS